MFVTTLELSWPLIAPIFNLFDRFEITSTITPWIVRHEVQLLINRIYNKFRNLKTVGNSAKETIKALVIDVRITWVSNYSYPITKSSNWIPVIGHPRDRAPITRQISAREPITIENFVTDTINN